MTGAFDRTDALRRLADTTFDVLVVGGGITGAGVALDAASRGLRTALVERDDLRRAPRRSPPSWSTGACGTSSRARSASSTRRSPSASACAGTRRTS